MIELERRLRECAAQLDKRVDYHTGADPEALAWLRIPIEIDLLGLKIEFPPADDSELVGLGRGREFIIPWDSPLLGLTTRVDTSMIFK